MRLFIAVPLPDQARQELSSVLDRLRPREWPVRWIRSEGAHLTLKFLGEVTRDRVDTIVEMMDFAVAGTLPIAMSLAGATAFPNYRRPRVLCLDVEAEPGLELLQDRLERGSEPLGFPPEGRVFHPHVTLGRVREGHRLPDGWRSELERIPTGTPFVADRVVLFESELGNGGPSYRARHEVLLR